MYFFYSSAIHKAVHLENYAPVKELILYMLLPSCRPVPALLFAVDKGGLGVSSCLVFFVLRKVLFILSENMVHWIIWRSYVCASTSQIGHARCIL